MEMVVTELDGAVEVNLVGRLDTLGVERIETRFNASTVAAPGHALVNLSQTPFVSSMGMRMLITAAKAKRQRERQFLLVVPAGPVRELLEGAAIDTLIPMFMARDEAIAALAR